MPIYPPGFEPPATDIATNRRLLQHIQFFPLYDKADSIWKESRNAASTTHFKRPQASPSPGHTFTSSVTTMRQLLRLHAAPTNEDVSFFVHNVNNELVIHRDPYEAQNFVSLDEDLHQTRSMPHDSSDNARLEPPPGFESDVSKLIPRELQRLVGLEVPSSTALLDESPSASSGASSDTSPTTATTRVASATLNSVELEATLTPTTSLDLVAADASSYSQPPVKPDNLRCDLTTKELEQHLLASVGRCKKDTAAIPLPAGEWADEGGSGTTAAIDYLLELADFFHKRTPRRRLVGRHLSSHKLRLVNDSAFMEFCKNNLSQGPQISPAGSCDPYLVLQRLSKLGNGDRTLRMDDAWLEGLLLGAEHIGLFAFRDQDFEEATLKNRHTLFSNEGFVREIERGIETLDQLSRSCASPNSSYWLYKSKGTNDAMLLSLDGSRSDQGNVPDVGFLLSNQCLQFAQLLDVQSDSLHLRKDILLKGVRSLKQCQSSRADDLRIALLAQTVDTELHILRRSLRQAPQQSSSAILVDQLEDCGQRLREVKDLIQPRTIWHCWWLKAKVQLVQISEHVSDQLRQRELHALIGSHLRESTAADLSSVLLRSVQTFLAARQSAFAHVVCASRDVLNFCREALTDSVISTKAQSLTLVEALNALTHSALHHGLFLTSVEQTLATTASDNNVAGTQQAEAHAQQAAVHAQPADGHAQPAETELMKFQNRLESRMQSPKLAAESESSNGFVSLLREKMSNVVAHEVHETASLFNRVDRTLGWMCPDEVPDEDVRSVSTLMSELVWSHSSQIMLA